MAVLARDLVLVGFTNLWDISWRAGVKGLREEGDLYLRFQQLKLDILCQVVDKPHDCLMAVAITPHQLHLGVIGSQLVQLCPFFGNALEE